MNKQKAPHCVWEQLKILPFCIFLCKLGLEISERPLKRPLLDFEKLSLSGSSGKGIRDQKIFFLSTNFFFPEYILAIFVLMLCFTFVLEELKVKKVFVRHVETKQSTEITAEIVHSFVVSLGSIYLYCYVTNSSLCACVSGMPCWSMLPAIINLLLQTWVWASQITKSRLSCFWVTGALLFL